MLLPLFHKDGVNVDQLVLEILACVCNIITGMYVIALIQEFPRCTRQISVRSILKVGRLAQKD